MRNTGRIIDRDYNVPVFSGVVAGDISVYDLGCRIKKEIEGWLRNPAHPERQMYMMHVLGGDAENVPAFYLSRKDEDMMFAECPDLHSFTYCLEQNAEDSDQQHLVVWLWQPTSGESVPMELLAAASLDEMMQRVAVGYGKYAFTHHGDDRSLLTAIETNYKQFVALVVKAKCLNPTEHTATGAATELTQTGKFWASCVSTYEGNFWFEGSLTDRVMYRVKRSIATNALGHYLITVEFAQHAAE